MCTRCHLLVWAFCLVSCVSASGAETVGIDASSGAPQLQIDGQPARARIFWGAPGSRPLPIGPAGRVVSFEFTPTQDEPQQATMHFRFGQTAGDIWLDNIRVTDLTERRDVVPPCGFENGITEFDAAWTTWPVGDQNTVGQLEVVPGTGQDGSAALHVALHGPATGAWPDYHLYHRPNLELHQTHRYRVALWVRADPARELTVAFYRPGRVFTFLGGPPSGFESQIQLAAKVGVDIVSFPVHMPWPRPGEAADWTTTDQQCRAVLQTNPQALLLPRIGMGAPGWWQAEHPDDVMVWDAGPQQHSNVVVASPDYRRDAAERLHALITHLEEQFGPHLAGYHPCGQNTGEWFYQETWGPALSGYAPGSLRAWRRWLSERYVNDATLQSAWGDSQATLANVDVPTPVARRAAPAGTLRDPITEQSLIDFAQFQQEMMADCVCALARAARDSSHGKRLVVFFYGYVFEFGAIRNGPAISGHYALQRVLQCPDIDVLCSPISYFDRGLGQSAPAMTAAESVALAGKMWLYEDDTRTHIATGRFPGWQAGADTLEETNNLLLRNTAQCIVRNFGSWWMDLGASGWFDDSRMWDQMELLRPLDEYLLHHPCPYRPEVAAVLDEPSMIRVACGGDAVTRPGVYEVRAPLGRMGAPYGQYLLDDVVAGRVRAKLYVMLNAWCLDQVQRRQLREATRDAAVVWCYAPGYHDGNQVSMEAMHELTGFQLHQLSGVNALAEPTRAGRELGLHDRIGVDAPLRPLFTPLDARPDEILAAYPDGSPAIVLREAGAGLTVFVGPPGLSSELLRGVAQRAGVHLFCQTDCNVYANGPFLVLHGSQDAGIPLDTGRPEPVRDLLTGRLLGTGPRLEIPLTKGETRVLQIGP